MTRQSSSTDFIPLPAALDHVAARERAPALAKRLLTRALADGLPARGYMIHHWPPYEEGIESLDPELFTDYGPQAPPARIERDGSAIMSGWAHPHFECRVLNLEVDKTGLLARWPGPLKRAPRRPSIRRLVQQAEASGRPVASVTMPDGTKLDFSKAEQQGDAVDEWIAKHADKTQGH
jgi:hypothetical protein